MDTANIISIISVLFSVSALGLIYKLSKDDREQFKQKKLNELERQEIENERQKMHNEILRERINLKDDILTLTDFKGEHRGSPNAEEGYYEIFEKDEVSGFYDLVAPHYDRRNMGPYGETYIAIFDLAIKHISKTSNLKICDLGGGTGWLLRQFEALNPFWLNVDFSQGALDYFNKKYTEYKNKKTINRDIRDDHSPIDDSVYDIVIINFLFSSMDIFPRLEKIKNLMNSKSILIFSDNHFSYVYDNPKYGFKNIEGRNIAINPTPMHSEYIKYLFKKNGFIHCDEEYVNIESIKVYSQVHLFRI